jgi:hypothetical protein
MKSEPIKYPDGNAAETGDCIRMDNGQREGRVTTVLDSTDTLKQWGVTERGLMVKNDYYGLVFLSERHLAGDEIVLISRSKS